MVWKSSILINIFENKTDRYNDGVYCLEKKLAVRISGSSVDICNSFMIVIIRANKSVFFSLLINVVLFTNRLSN